MLRRMLLLPQRALLLLRVPRRVLLVLLPRRLLPPPQLALLLLLLLCRLLRQLRHILQIHIAPLMHAPVVHLSAAAGVVFEQRERAVPAITNHSLAHAAAQAPGRAGGPSVAQGWFLELAAATGARVRHRHREPRGQAGAGCSRLARRRRGQAARSREIGVELHGQLVGARDVAQRVAGPRDLQALHAAGAAARRDRRPTMRSRSRGDSD